MNASFLALGESVRFDAINTENFMIGTYKTSQICSSDKQTYSLLNALLFISIQFDSIFLVICLFIVWWIYEQPFYVAF